MLVKTLDGETYEWEISAKIAKGNKRKSSKGHTTVCKIIRELYPVCQIYEELPIFVESNQKLYIDIYVPTLNLAVEIQGRQHYEYISHFHKSKLDFLKALARDGKKKTWCEINGIKLIILKYDEERLWQEQLMTK